MLSNIARASIFKTDKVVSLPLISITGQKVLVVFGVIQYRELDRKHNISTDFVIPEQ